MLPPSVRRPPRRARLQPRHPGRSLLAFVVVVATSLSACFGEDEGSPSPPIAPAPSSAAPSVVPTGPAGSPGSSASPGAPSGPGSPPPSRSPFDLSVRLRLEPVVDLPGSPLGAVNAGDGSGRLFVVEQGGRILIVRDGRLEPEPFLDIADRITSGGERGLLGLAFHPNYPDDPRFFVDYTDRNGDTVVASYRVTGDDPDRADPDSEAVVLRVDQPFANHNGGAVVFGPDGLLYVGLGDGGSGGDPQDNGQRLDTLLGKILRLDVDHDAAGAPYAIPADNPFVGRDGIRPEIWLTGLRNPWRITFDRATRDLWIGDVGQGSFEEIDVFRAGSTPGVNYGWARAEGFHCYPSGNDCEGGPYEWPVAEYSHDDGCSVTGGYVYRGSAFPELDGGYVFSDYCSGTLWLLDAGRDGVQEPTTAGESGRSISSFGEDEAGELYATDLGGTLLRVIVDR